MRPLSILKVVDAWKWFAEAEQMYQASLALAARGHRISIACQPGSPAAARAKEAGLEVHALPGLRSPRLPTTPLLNVGRLARIIETVAPDVVHAYRSPPHVLCAAALALTREPRPALVRTRGGAQPIRRGVMNRHVYDRLTAVTLVTSARIRDDMLAGGFDAERIALVPCVVDPAPLAHPDAEAFRRSVGAAPSTRLVSVVGRLARVKGHRHLVEALPEIVRRHGDVLLCVVGPHDDVPPETLVSQAESLGVAAHLVVTGARDDVASVLAGSDVVAIASVGSEVISRVLLEAMWLGRPVVATRVGVIPEIARDGETAVLVPPADAGALAEAIGGLLAAPDRARRLGEAASAVVRAGHLPEHLADALEAVYERVAAGRTEEGGAADPIDPPPPG